MAKSDYICGGCKKKRGTDWRGQPTQQYECAEHGAVCRDCVDVKKTLLGFGAPKRVCRRCDGEVLLLQFIRGRWMNI